jgi:hypothetical protein
LLEKFVLEPVKFKGKHGRGNKGAKLTAGAKHTVGFPVQKAKTSVFGIYEHKYTAKLRWGRRSICRDTRDIHGFNVS